ncbi:uncharacterized protein AtWU_00544 [Aspergillus tubingensis]|uniref:uncharacterized protein n=1 Tax=Aspergillus tubingensis TaxID=5068 RepID=UPI00157813BA|nr:uncharacterized protein AtWU_00544 [Aspergillus tubingensis]GFN10749.1 hypothetical protein AtWU_00544 [Aspergillus tubingensis]
MLGPKGIVLWVALSLLVSNVVALDVTELFNLPASGNAYGDCSSHQARLTNYASDFSSLATQMNNALPGSSLLRGLVIKFDGNGVLLWESQMAWNVVTDHIQRLQDVITNNGVYPAWTSPANLFCGDFGEPLSWDFYMFDSAGDYIDPPTTVQNMYGDWASYIGGAQVPYWVPSLNEYHLISPTTFTADAMCSDTSGLEGLNSFGNSPSLTNLMMDCLSLALDPYALGTGVAQFAYQNTENYVHFALAWWYYNCKTVGTATPATFYAGFLQKWDHT